MVNIPETDIAFYTDSTPNGQKVAITLEELGLKYEVVHVDISKGTQKEDWFLKINPNGRIPAIVDRTKDDGKSAEKRIFEGGAIMLYLCQKYDKNETISYPFDTAKYWEVVEWLVWMQSGLGPMQGQANHFYRYAPEKINYAIDRYQTETKRLYNVLDTCLASQKANNYTAANTPASSAGAASDFNQGPLWAKAEQGATPAEKGPWIVGDKMTIADLACFSWVNWAEWAGIDLEKEDFPHVKEWADRINQREAVKKGLDVPKPFTMKEKMKTKEGAEEYGKRQSEWIMKGQESDQKKHSSVKM